MLLGEQLVPFIAVKITRPSIRVIPIPIFDHQWIAFEREDEIFTGPGREDLMALAYNSGDFLLAIDGEGVIQDISGPHDTTAWMSVLRGKPLAETVTADSRAKVENLTAKSKLKPHQERHVNHIGPDGAVPAGYRFMAIQDGEWLLAIGKDLRPLADLQQRTMMAQQVIERDYASLRQSESRYRVLFQSISQPTMIVAAKTRLIEQANAACDNIFGVDARSLVNKDFLDLLDVPSQQSVLGYFGALSVSDAIPPITLSLAPSRVYSGARDITISANIFRQGKTGFYLLTLDPGAAAEPESASHRQSHRQTQQQTVAMVEALPDSFVLADDDLNIVYANPAFIVLLNAYSAQQLYQMPLDQFVGRPAVDLALIRRELDNNGSVRNFASIINDVNGESEQVEITAAIIEGDEPLYAFSLRNVGRRERDLSPVIRSELQSVEQLTGLVGRKSLKEIVRESTDLIESMCIQAALKHTGDNRASAAEILGVSRQSLYSKMRLHNLGNRDDD